MRKYKHVDNVIMFKTIMVPYGNTLWEYTNSLFSGCRLRMLNKINMAIISLFLSFWLQHVCCQDFPFSIPTL